MPYSAAVLDASSNNIPTTYDTSSGSLILNGTPTGGVLAFINTTETVLSFEVGRYQGGSVPASTLPGKGGFIPAAPTGGSGVAVIDGINITQGDSIFIRSTSGVSVSSGKLYCFIK